MAFQFSCDGIVNRCLDFTTRKAKYVCHLEKNLEKLREAMESVSRLKNDVALRVRLAEQQNRTRTNEVAGWLTSVQNAETAVPQILQQSSAERQELCFGGCCSKSLFSTYNFGKKVYRKLQHLERLENEGKKHGTRDLTQLAEKSPTNLAEKRPTEGEIVGRESLIEDILENLLHEPVGIIELTGMGGVGKTTLLEQINNKFCDKLNGFNRLIWVNMRKGMKEQEVQDIIAKKIGVFDESWDAQSVDNKGVALYNKLRKERFILFLDDLWEPIDLKSVGVGNLLEKGLTSSKLVFTTRQCKGMDVHKSFKVDCLGREVAQILFNSKVGEETLNSHSGIRGYAEEVASRCDGLPLALKIIGQAMSRKNTLAEWLHAIELLDTAPVEFEDAEERLYTRLKISYDSLTKGFTKSCFLYCSLYAEDFKISRKNLVDYWIGEGFLKKNKGAQFEGHAIIGELIRACLLEKDDSDHVKMHDVVRNMALWINREENFVQKSREAPSSEAMDGKRRISLMGNEIENLEVRPNCPDLVTLFLNHNNLKTISDGFFHSMSKLKVLNLSENKLLINLSPEVSKLSSLEHLDLSNTGIEVLPKDLGFLKKLTCFNLERTTQLRTIPKKLISSFLMLRVLRMLSCGSSEPTAGSLMSDDGSHLIEELCSLKRLEMLTMSLSSSEAFNKFLKHDELQKCTQSLCLQNLQNQKSFTILKENMERLDTLHLVNCKHIEQLKINRRGGCEQVPRGFDCLEVVEISKCPKLKDLTWLVLASNLKRLVVSDCYDIEEIFNVGKLGKFTEAGRTINLFPELEFLKLQKLPKLGTIYKEAVQFHKLKEIIVDQCKNLQKLPLDHTSANDGKLIIQGHRSWWNQLDWEDRSIGEAFHPFFKALL